MNKKFFSFLTMLLLGMGLTFGFAACSDDDDDDDNNNTEETSSADKGKSAGEKFVQDVEAYQAIEGNDITANAKKLEAAGKIYKDYTNYKENKEDKEWKTAFLKGAAGEDLQKHETISKFLEKDYSSIEGIAGALTDLAGLFSNNSQN